MVEPVGAAGKDISRSVPSLPNPTLSTAREAFQIAATSLRANKLHIVLALVGIVVGVATVTTVVTIIKGLDQMVASTFSSQGATVFTVTRHPQVILSREEAVKFNKRRNVTQEDADVITRACSPCWRTGISASSVAAVKHGSQKSEGVRIRGATASVFVMEGVGVEAGRTWSEAESRAAREVSVIGADVLDNVFGGARPESVVGQEVRIEGRPFTVVGVAERLGKIFGFSRDNFVLIPYQTYRKIYGAYASISIHVQAPTAEQLPEVADHVRSIMRHRRGKETRGGDDGFTLETQDVFLNLYGKATSNIYIVAVAVAAVSLVVGGIVVMNLMLVSVTERTKEIGIRKAVGARRRDILLQFLTEAVAVTATGGVLGVGAGFNLSYVISYVLGFPLLLSAESAVLGVAVSMAVGVVSGLWPAWRAAHLDPVEALRSE